MSKRSFQDIPLSDDNLDEIRTIFEQQWKKTRLDAEREQAEEEEQEEQAEQVEQVEQEEQEEQEEVNIPQKKRLKKISLLQFIRSI